MKKWQRGAPGGRGVPNVLRALNGSRFFVAAASYSVRDAQAPFSTAISDIRIR
jgi:hypothetical protein